jgi:hypothetical protein
MITPLARVGAAHEATAEVDVTLVTVGAGTPDGAVVCKHRMMEVGGGGGKGARNQKIK